MNSLKITGLFGLIGSVMVGIGEFLLHFNAGGYGEIIILSLCQLAITV